MTPDRQKQAREKLRHTAVRDDSKAELYTLLSEAMDEIKELEENIQSIENGTEHDYCGYPKGTKAWMCNSKDCPGHIVGVEDLPGFMNGGCTQYGWWGNENKKRDEA